LAVEHALTRTVRDSAALLDAVTGGAPGDPYNAPLPAQSFRQAIGQPPLPQRILIATGSPFPAPPTDPRVVAAVETAGRALESAGHHIEPGAPGFDVDAVADAIAVLHNVSNVRLYNLARSHLGRDPREDEFEPSSAMMMREGFTTAGVDYADAIATIHTATRQFVAGMGSHDVLLVPTLLAPPPHYGVLDQARGSTRAFFDFEFAHTGWTVMANVTGWAAISLPLALTEDSLPIGVQLMAPDEAVLLQLAAQLEQAIPWTQRRPRGWLGATVA
jgi:amidase